MLFTYLFKNVRRVRRLLCNYMLHYIIRNIYCNAFCVKKYISTQCTKIIFICAIYIVQYVTRITYKIAFLPIIKRRKYIMRMCHAQYIVKTYNAHYILIYTDKGGLNMDDYKTPDYVRRANNNYIHKFERVTVLLEKGTKARIYQKYGDGVSINAYIKGLINADLNGDGTNNALPWD